jgi:hypothetical protein
MSLSRAFAVVLALVAFPGLTSVVFAADLGRAFPPAACGNACASPRAPAIRYPVLSPIAPVPVEPAPIAVDHWDTHGFGDCKFPGDYFGACGNIGRCGWFGGPGPCGGPPAPCGACGRPGAYLPAPTPIYIVNQGPDYSGPGLMIPFKTYSPTNGLAMPRAFPYISARSPRYVQVPQEPQLSFPAQLGVRD